MSLVVCSTASGPPPPRRIEERAVRRRARVMRALPVLIAVLLAACASRPTTPPAPTTLRYPDFRYPTVPADADAIQAMRVERGWRYLQVDNQRNAEREFQAALKLQPSFHPAATGLGYLELARRDLKDAVTYFDRALEAERAYVPALVGRGQALLELGREGEALASFEAAVKADPSLTDLQGRIEVLRFRAVQDNLARAKAASDAGRFSEARAAYAQAIAASPESAFLYRDLALVERRAGQLDEALQHFEKAVSLDPADAVSHAQIGSILEARGDIPGALAAYEKARAIDPEEVSAEHVAKLREAEALALMPEEYRAIPESSNATRAELAALLGVRLANTIARARPRQAVITDVRDHWAQQWITTVVRAGLMDTQPNYTFQPNARLRRADVAQTVARVLNIIASKEPGTPKPWQNAKQKIADVPPGHLSYAAVSAAVASGVMPLTEKGTFELLRPLSGAELIDIVARLEALAK
jgi:tetratricopeptide (TPR) repeat protein